MWRLYNSDYVWFLIVSSFYCHFAPEYEHLKEQIFVAYGFWLKVTVQGNFPFNQGLNYNTFVAFKVYACELITCFIFSYVKDVNFKANLTICRPSLREKKVFESNGHIVDIQFVNLSNKETVLFKYEGKSHV